MLLDSKEYPEYFGPYINKVSGQGNLSELLSTTFQDAKMFLKSIEEAQKDFAYEAEKWTIAQVFQHLIDVEKVMAYRAFRISRDDKTDLPGFDHNLFAEVAKVDDKTLAQLLEELETVRNTSILHFRNLNEQETKRIGSVSGNNISTRALGFIMIGHIIHHIEILKNRYLKYA